MIDLQAILADFRTLVTFNQNLNPKLQLESDLVVNSDSNRKFNIGASPYVSIDNLYNFSENFNLIIDKYDLYDVLNTYSIGQRVKSSANELYESIINANTGNDLTDVGSWKLIDLFSEYLRNKIDGVSQQVLSDVLFSKTLLDNNVLNAGYTYNEQSNFITNKNSLVGYKVYFNGNDVNLRVVIDKIGLQFDKAMTDLPIYFYHSSQPSAPVFTTTVDTLDNDFIWNNINQIVLSYVSSLVDAGGVWYIVYNQNDLTAAGAKALNTAYMQNQNTSKYVNFVPIELSLNNVTGTELPAYNNQFSDTTLSYGLNFNFSVKCEYTDFVLQQRMLFAEAIWLQFAYNFLQEIASNANIRTNRTERVLNETVIQDVMFQLNADNTNTFALVNRLKKAIDKLKKSLDMERVCLPCEEKNSYFKLSYSY